LVVILAIFNGLFTLAVEAFHSFLVDSASIFYISRLNWPVPKLKRITTLCEHG
jgi:hypothetical protein